jgi:hypothetical protein
MMIIRTLEIIKLSISSKMLCLSSATKITSTKFIGGRGATGNNKKPTIPKQEK